MIATESTEDTERKHSVLLSVLWVKKGGNQFSLVVFCTTTFDVLRNWIRGWSRSRSRDKNK